MKQIFSILSEAATDGAVLKKVFLKFSQNSHENTCARVCWVLLASAYNFIKKETLALGFSFEYCEMFKITPGGCFFSFL